MANCDACGANALKTKVMCINITLEAPLTIASITPECVDSFTYLGSVQSKDGSAQKDIKNRLSKARNAFAILRPVWRSSIYSIRTKLHLYNNIVKCICLILWPRTIINLDLHAKTHSERIRTVINKRRLLWLGYVLSMSPNRITRVALRWTTQGIRKQGRPKATWWRKRLRQWVSHGARLKWSLWTELVKGSEWRSHIPRWAKSKKTKNESEYEALHLILIYNRRPNILNVWSCWARGQLKDPFFLLIVFSHLHLILKNFVSALSFQNYLI